ncbi:MULTISPECIES: hypothetical protein [unclassified Synechococcus]|uniref:hypothetical protein n=1 Tax=unclassified Synechococcus TaxID=2626047 RepID=UPI002AD353C3|nr:MULTISPECIES: hypothetical protein [unclassified Synechococcus]
MSAVLVVLPPAQGSCLAPVWANQGWEWKHGPWKILAVSVGLLPEPGFALELVSGLLVQGCIDVDATGPGDLDRKQ